MIYIGRTVAFLWCLVIFGVCGENIPQIQDIEERTCSLQEIKFNVCNAKEACVSVTQTTGVCRCSKDFVRSPEDGSCQPVPTKPPITPPPPIAASSSDGFGFTLFLWLIIPVVLAGALGVVFYTGRQKMWLNRLYQMRIRSYNNVL